jgi:hypothetical protein
MTDWCGSNLLLTRVAKKPVVRALTVDVAHHQNVSPPLSLGGSRDRLKAKF